MGMDHAPDPTRDLRETLTVQAVAGRQVLVATHRASACSACAVKSGCGAAALASMSKDDELVLDVPDGVRAAPGDRVVVALPGAALVKAAGLGYLLPLVVLVAAASVLSGLGLPDLVVGFLALTFFMGAFAPLWFAERRERTAPGLRVVDVIPAGQG